MFFWFGFSGLLELPIFGLPTLVPTWVIRTAASSLCPYVARKNSLAKKPVPLLPLALPSPLLYMEYDGEEAAPPG